MRHLDDDLLAGIALDEPDELSARDRAHLLVCRACAARLAELEALVATGRAGEPGPARPPGPSVLAAIQAVLADDPPAAQASGPSPVALLEHRRSTRTRPSPARWLVAAAAVLAVAVGGAVWYRSAGAEVVVARTELTSLPEKEGRGTAQLVERDGGLQLTVDVSRPAVSDAFEELWLINTDGRRMISLGVVPPDGRGTYTVPLSQPGLDGYTVVDISLEPFDGNAAHSRDSLLRGTLT